MGAPKQKWTAEEEQALKAGIAKHGAGKWSAILKDPEFSSTLFSRSNVDLKDKWRNIRVIPTGRGYREKATLSMKKNRSISKRDIHPMALCDEELLEEPVDAKPIAVETGPPQSSSPKKPEAKLEDLILEAITNLKEPLGVSKTAITLYIEENLKSPPDLKLTLSEKLKEMTESDKLTKVKHNYRIKSASELGRRNSMEGRHRQQPSRTEKVDVKQHSKPQVDAGLAQMGVMNPEKAAAAAAQAVAEAELAMMEAEEAMRKAEAAEAEAEAAQAFAEAISLTLRERYASQMMVQV